MKRFRLGILKGTEHPVRGGPLLVTQLSIQFNNAWHKLERWERDPVTAMFVPRLATFNAADYPESALADLMESGQIVSADLDGG